MGTIGPGATDPRPWRWAVAAEWTKLRSVRSTTLALVATGAVCVGLGALICAATASRWSQLAPIERASFDAANRSLRGVFLGQLVIGALGVLVVTAEFTTGTIRASAAAVPVRARLAAAKVAVFGPVAAVVGLATAFAAFGIGQALLPRGVGVSLSDPSVLRAVLGAGAYLGLVAMIGLGIGTIVRSTAVGISALVGLVFVVPLLSEALPASLRDHFAPYLPVNAGISLFSVRTDAHALAPGAALLVLVAYAAVALVVGGVMLVRRDV